MQILAVSVLPAPLSPETKIDCAPPVCAITVYAERATLKTCGGSVSGSATAASVRIRSGVHSAVGANGLSASTMWPMAV